MIELKLPSLGADMDEGTLVQWQVQPGDAVHKGQVVAVVDTAKAAIDVECWHDGTVDRLVAEPGVKLAVGSTLAWLRAPGEAATEPPAALPAEPPVLAPVAGPGERLRISPAARRAAQQRGIELHTLRGSGQGGAIELADLPAPAASVPAAPTDRAAAMRRVIGAAMSRAKREIPHYYLSDDIVFANAAAWLAERNRTRAPADRLLPAALLLKAVAMALRRYPHFNGFWRDDAFVPGAGIHLGTAVALRTGGLVAPALHDVDRSDTAAITRALLDLVRRTRAGSLRSSELADATLTVTNLGEHSVASVLGVIYPPQVALLGFGCIAARPWVDEQGALCVRPVLTATLAADHRASDGHSGALLLIEIRELLQEPAALDASR
jgi:pyruvate dehydrogenase E2 component (dihydrolipoamide acetyltransferase)